MYFPPYQLLNSASAHFRLMRMPFAEPPQEVFPSQVQIVSPSTRTTNPTWLVVYPPQAENSAPGAGYLESSNSSGYFAAVFSAISSPFPPPQSFPYQFQNIQCAKSVHQRPQPVSAKWPAASLRIAAQSSVCAFGSFSAKPASRPPPE